MRNCDKDTQEVFLLTKKIILLVAICATIIAVVFIVIGQFDLWDKFKSIDAVRSWIEGAGAFSVVIYGVIVFLQVIVLPIPSTVTNIVAVMLFDPWITFLVTTLCTWAGSYVCFAIGRIFGKKVVNWLIGEEKTTKYANLLNEKGRFLFIMMLLLPCFPDDILCMVAGLSSMSWGFFSLAIFLARPAMIALVSFFGSAAIDAIDTWGIPVSIGVFAVVIAFVVFISLYRGKKEKKDKLDYKENNG